MQKSFKLSAMGWIPSWSSKSPRHKEFQSIVHEANMSRVSCQKGPTRHAYAWQIGPFWQDTLDVRSNWANIVPVYVEFH